MCRYSCTRKQQQSLQLHQRPQGGHRMLQLEAHVRVGLGRNTEPRAQSVSELSVFLVFGSPLWSPAQIPRRPRSSRRPPSAAGRPMAGKHTCKQPSERNTLKEPGWKCYWETAAAAYWNPSAQ